MYCAYVSWYYNKMCKSTSEAIETDQLVELMVAKVTIDTDWWKVHNESVY